MLRGVCCYARLDHELGRHPWDSVGIGPCSRGRCMRIVRLEVLSRPCNDVAVNVRASPLCFCASHGLRNDIVCTRCKAM
eukprot:4079080-Amphidinium_carterae.1